MDQLPVLDKVTPEGRELLAPDSKRLSLAQICKFSPLRSEPQSLAVTDTALFTDHLFLKIPCDYQCDFARKRRRVQGMADFVHVFHVQRELAEHLNVRLAELALQKERWARARLQGEEAEANVSKSNWGGFQSHDDCFVDRTDDPEAYRRMACLRELHRLCSAAMDELCVDVDPESRPQRVGELCGGVAWINVNRPEDLNFLHVHEEGKYSGVYFVQPGEIPPSDPKHRIAGGLNGHLVFRGGMQRDGVDGETHSYLAVPPEAGALWIFPGTMPHCVFPRRRQAPSGSHREELSAAAARISVAINFDESAPPSVML